MSEVTFKKLPKNNDSLFETAYQVFVGGEPIGFVWSERGFSYRGTEEWHHIGGKEFRPLSLRYTGCDRTRKAAVEKLLDDQK